MNFLHVKLQAKVMEEMGVGEKLEDVVLEGPGASGWEELTFKGGELGFPTRSISAKKETELEPLG